MRNAAYDHGMFSVYRPPVPVIAVGNMTAGGTGKTPLVAWLMAYTRGKGMRPVVLSRGYGRRTKGVRIVSDGTRLLTDATEGGDEPVQLARSFPDVPVVVGESRREAALEALRRFAPGVFLLDDAFQHRAIARDLNILVVDGSRDLAAEGLLPAGRRREPLRGIGRASVVVFTHTDPLTGEAAGAATVRTMFRGDILTCTRTIGSFVDSTGAASVASQWQGVRCVLVSGIGKPDRFERDIRALGLDVAEHVMVPDHHRYDQGDVTTIADAVVRNGAQRIVTTEKDMVRLMAVPGAIAALDAKAPVMAALLDVQVHPAGVLESHCDRVIGRGA